MKILNREQSDVGVAGYILRLISLTYHCWQANGSISVTSSSYANVTDRWGYVNVVASLYSTHKTAMYPRDNNNTWQGVFDYQDFMIVNTLSAKPTCRHFADDIF